MLTKAKNVGKTKDEESVNIIEDALGYKIEDGSEEIDETLVAGAYGACNFCNKKGHFKKDCPDYKDKLLKIRRYKEGKGEKWLSPKKYAEMRKAQIEKKAQNKEKMTLLTQTSSTAIKTTKMYDENQMNDESEYDSYITSYSVMAVEEDQKDDDPND